jgi:hypothetical protein
VTRAHWLFALAACLWLPAVVRDAGDRWVEATVLPPLVLDSSVEVLDRNGVLLRAFQVEDGRWRLAVDQGSVDPAYLAMLVFMGNASGGVPPQLMGVLFGGVAGIMVYISLDELLPTSRAYGKGHDSLLGLFAGMGVMALSLLLMKQG